MEIDEVANGNNRFYLPGQAIRVEEYSQQQQRQAGGTISLGPGIYRQGNNYYASLAGYLKAKVRQDDEDDDRGERLVLSIDSTHLHDDDGDDDDDDEEEDSNSRPPSHGSSRVPRIGQTCWGTVVRVTSKYATVAISILLDHHHKTLLLKDPFKGTIRQQDVMTREGSAIEEAPSASASTSSTQQPPTQAAPIILPVASAFRPGDIVRARVIGLGDAGSGGYFLSTSLDPSDGVVYARSSASGMPMVPVAWNEMQCPETGTRERRKVAKPE